MYFDIYTKIAYWCILTLRLLPVVTAVRVITVLGSNGSIVRRQEASYTRILLLRWVAGLNSVGLGSLNRENGFSHT